MLPTAFKVVGRSIKNGFKLEASSPVYQETVHSHSIPWTEEFRARICSGFKAIKVWCVLSLTFHTIYDITGKVKGFDSPQTAVLGRPFGFV